MEVGWGVALGSGLPLLLSSHPTLSTGDSKGALGTVRVLQQRPLTEASQDLFPECNPANVT